MLHSRSLLHFLFLLIPAIAGGHETLIRTLPDDSSTRSVGDEPAVAYCKSWRLSVETNNAGHWRKIPGKCAGVVKQYVNVGQYASDSKMVARLSQSHAKTIKVAGDGKDVWIFDVDETLISNAQHYARHGYESKVSNESAFNQWISSGEATALPWSLWLYKRLQARGFQLILLTGRKETHRNSTEQNLMSVGYRSWKKLIMREDLDVSKTAMVYKSEKRAVLEGEGFRIHGNSGDQWSDLFGMPRAKRSFKLPNPMYHIP